MFLRELGVMGVIGVILFFFVSWGIISFIQRRRRIWRKLRSAVYPEFQPSEFYVQSTQGIAIDAVRQRFAVATLSTITLFTAADVIDVRRSSKQGNPQYFNSQLISLRSICAPLPYRMCVSPRDHLRSRCSASPRC